MHVSLLCRYSISGHPSVVTALACAVSSWCHLVVQEENAWVSNYSKLNCVQRNLETLQGSIFL